MSYIIRQKVLRKAVVNIKHVRSTVLNIEDFIRAINLIYRHFISLLQDLDAECTDVFYHSNVRWLSSGKVLKIVWDLQDEILMFFDMKDKVLMIHN
jgi:hypothetical protein